MASLLYSSDRVYCADCRLILKKKQVRTKDFPFVSEIGVAALKASLPVHKARAVKDNDQLCRSCFKFFKEKVSEPKQPETSPESEGSSEDQPYVHKPNATE